ncbi:MAG: hypothetical protein FWH22_05470, partial [Fibromonadales bacterium]|nr:hypothetical protein [Fibromonadales bacterium]
MYKIRILALFAISAMLFACGSQDGSPPKLIEDGKTLQISPFEPLIAVFDSKIASVKEDNLIYDNENMKLAENQPSNKELRFIGESD